MRIFKGLVVGLFFGFWFWQSALGSTITNNEFHTKMYHKNENQLHAKAEFYIYTNIVKPALLDKYYFYLNETIDLEDRVIEMQKKWNKHAKRLSKLQSIVLSPPILDNLSLQNIIEDQSKELLKETAKKLIELTVSNVSGEITDNKNLQKELTKNFTPILNLSVDFIDTETNKEKMAIALEVFYTTMANTAVNVGGFFRGMQLRSYYTSYQYLMDFLTEYYKNGADLDKLIKKNNIKPNFYIKHLRHSNYKIYVRNIFSSYTGEAINSNILDLAYKNIIAIEKVATFAISAEKTMQRNIRNAKYMNKYALSAKVKYLKEHKIDPYFIEIDSTSSHAISKNIYIGDFLYSLYQISKSLFERGIDVWSLESVKSLSENYEYQNITISKAVKILDEYSLIAFKKISTKSKLLYERSHINPKGNKLIHKELDKLTFNKFTKNKSVDISIKRQFLGVQGKTIATNMEEFEKINTTTLKGYKAIIMLYNLRLALDKLI